MRQEWVSKEQLQVQATLEIFRLEHRYKDNDLPRIVSEIIDYINEVIFDPRLNVKFLKSQCRIRDHNFSSRFRYIMGVTIKGYIEELRLEAAELLLREIAISVFDVASSVGYYHPQTFYRAFERRFHCTPAEYRFEHGLAMRSIPVIRLPGAN